MRVARIPAPHGQCAVVANRQCLGLGKHNSVAKVLFFGHHFGCYRPCECAPEKCEIFGSSQLNPDEGTGVFWSRSWAR